jgi:hypothetical protein
MYIGGVSGPARGSGRTPDDTIETAHTSRPDIRGMPPWSGRAARSPPAEKDVADRHPDPVLCAEGPVTWPVELFDQSRGSKCVAPV